MCVWWGLRAGRQDLQTLNRMVAGARRLFPPDGDGSGTSPRPKRPTLAHHDSDARPPPDA
jgi:hypothetical protein